jgi:hypothetical protein
MTENYKHIRETFKLLSDSGRMSSPYKKIRTSPVPHEDMSGETAALSISIKQVNKNLRNIIL